MIPDLGDQRAHQQVRRKVVGGQGARQLLRGHVADRGDRGGVADHDVGDRLLGQPGCELADLAEEGEVGSLEPQFGAGNLGKDAVACSREALIVAADHDHRHPSAGKGAGDRLADAVGCSRHDCAEMVAHEFPPPIVHCSRRKNASAGASAGRRGLLARPSDSSATSMSGRFGQSASIAPRPAPRRCHGERASRIPVKSGIPNLLTSPSASSAIIPESSPLSVSSCRGSGWPRPRGCDLHQRTSRLPVAGRGRR